MWVSSLPVENAKAYDITLYGATGFVGRLTAAHLAPRCRELGLELAIAGRNREKLATFARELSDTLEVGILVASSEEPASLEAMAAASRVICSTVGPYARLGTPVVEAALAADSDYCDLTGEIQWIRRSADRFDADARRRGVRILHACGFDSVPSDLGVYLVQRRLTEERGAPAPALRLRLHRQAGGVSRGTLESMVGLFEEASRDRSIRRLLKDPHSLEPRWTGEERSSRAPLRDSATGGWVVPFIMEEVNRRVVYRSNALSGYSYGRDFRYSELFLLPPGVAGLAKAIAIRGAMGLSRLLLSFGPTRRLLRLIAFPPPGSGPQIAREGGGHFDCRIEDPETGTEELRISADRDPGYGATAIMVGESAILLARTKGAPGVEGGVLTPAVALAEALAEALTGQGVRFDPRPKAHH